MTAFACPQRVSDTTPRATSNRCKFCIFSVPSIGACRAISFAEESEEPTMETWMSAAVLVEATMLSFLVALWMGWMSLRGLFWMMPGNRLAPAPARLPARQTARIPARHTA